MKIAPVADVAAQFSAYLDDCQDGPVIITRNGWPVAVLVAPLDDEDLERLVLAYTPRFRRLLDQASERIQSNGGLGEDDFWPAVERATGEGKAV